MSWSFHQYYTNRSDGLISKLLLTENEKNKLKELRKIVRLRTKDVFEEAKIIANDVKRISLTKEEVQSRLVNTKIKYLSEEDQHKIAKLIHDLDDDAREEFLNLTPRFWTQGSFQYDTLNRPFHPGQEMDIDDGTYMPMPIFESEPKIGHTLLLLLVDSSLKSLAEENDGWKFERKQTCARIKISKEKTHIDVPMYAIPKDQFLKKQAAMNACFNEAVTASCESIVDGRESYKLDSEHVNLALREGDKKWCNSDPKVVEDWFNDSCSRIGEHLRMACRFMKAWRDAQWDVGGPSSISLMAAIVNILDKHTHDIKDLGETMKIIARHLPSEFSSGIESPDDTDEKLLFPAFPDHDVREQAIMEKLRQLHGILLKAEKAESKLEALEIINTAFGNRVTDHTLIIASQAAPAFRHDPHPAKKPVAISSTMVSG